MLHNWLNSDVVKQDAPASTALIGSVGVDAFLSNFGLFAPGSVSVTESKKLLAFLFSCSVFAFSGLCE